MFVWFGHAFMFDHTFMLVCLGLALWPPYEERTSHSRRHVGVTCSFYVPVSLPVDALV